MYSAYEMFSWYKYLIVSLVFSHLGFWSGILFLIAPFPDLCLQVCTFLKYQLKPDHDHAYIEHQIYSLTIFDHILPCLIISLTRFTMFTWAVNCQLMQIASIQ